MCYKTGQLTCSQHPAPAAPASPPNEPSRARRPARHVVVDTENEGRRLDNFLGSELPDVPRDRIHRLLRRGEVRVNSGRARAGQRLREGDTVRVPPVAVGTRDDADGTVGRERNLPVQRLEGAILFEDERLLVLDKPAGLAVHGGSGLSFGVIELLRAMRPDAPYLELVHRIDRETSGCLIVAKRRSALRALHEALRRRALDKRYVALVGGKLGKGRHRVELALERGRLASGERMVRVHEEGRTSETRLETIAAGRGVTLVEARPLTGRTHQIRVHCAAFGHPIAGDPKYGDRALNLRARRDGGAGRLFLHAASVRIEADGLAPVRVRAPLDPKLVEMATRLGVPQAALERYLAPDGD